MERSMIIVTHDDDDDRHKLSRIYLSETWVLSLVAFSSYRLADRSNDIRWSPSFIHRIPSARLTPDWEPYREDFRFMKIGMGRSPDISMKEGFLPIRMKFWRNLMSSVTAPMELIFPPQKNDDKNNGNDHYASAASQSYPNLLHPCLILSIVNLIYIFCS